MPHIGSPCNSAIPRHRRGGLIAAAAGTALLAIAAALGGTAQAHSGHAPVIINVGGGAYSPASATAYVGDNVFWAWVGPDYDHSVTLVDPREAFDSDPGKGPGQISHSAGDGFAHFFTHPGSYTYFDKAHPDIRGTIVIGAVPGSVPVAPPDPPVISALRMTRVPCRRKRRRCAKRLIVLRYRLSQDATMRLDVAAAGASSGTVLSSDFLGRRGANRQRLSLGRLYQGRFQLLLFATNARGYTSPPRRLSLRIR